MLVLGTRKGRGKLNANIGRDHSIKLVVFIWTRRDESIQPDLEARDRRLGSVQTQTQTPTRVIETRVDCGADRKKGDWARYI